MDKSQKELYWLRPNLIENKLKPLLRKPIYGIYKFLHNIYLKNKYKINFDVDQWLLGQRGNDYVFLRKKVNNYKEIKNKKIFIAGCGTGRDSLSWLKYNPEEITGVDFFNYEESWDQFKKYSLKNKYKTKLNFYQADLERLSGIPNEYFDIISSDAVFEHLNKFETICKEFYRILKPGGVLYSTFGPLYYSWGGDHYSGWDNIDSGYNHIILSKEKYKAYLAKNRYFSPGEEDGRRWITNNLFSYLKPIEYINLLNKSKFCKLFTSIMLDPIAIKCLRKRPDLKDELTKNHSYLDLLITGMTIIFKK